MITEEEKDRIRHEEIFRQEIREQLRKDSERKEGSKLWTVMNSAFFLWFLSSVLIGSISFKYARWEKQKEDERRNYEQHRIAEYERNVSEKKLDAEISSRLNYFGSMSGVTGDFESLLILDKPLETKYPVNVFPEYAHRSLQSLLWELLRVVPDESKGEVNRAYEVSKIFPKSFVTDQGIEKAAFLKVKAIISFEDLNLARWGKPFDD